MRWNGGNLSGEELAELIGRYLWGFGCRGVLFGTRPCSGIAACSG